MNIILTKPWGPFHSNVNLVHSCFIFRRSCQEPLIVNALCIIGNHSPPSPVSSVTLWVVIICRRGKIFKKFM